jgi:hypothetical protein
VSEATDYPNPMVTIEVGTGRPICYEALHSCRCLREPGHLPPHQCDVRCGGEWDYDSDGTLRIVTIPYGAPNSAPRFPDDPPIDGPVV